MQNIYITAEQNPTKRFLFTLQKLLLENWLLISQSKCVSIRHTSVLFIFRPRKKTLQEMQDMIYCEKPSKRSKFSLNERFNTEPRTTNKHKLPNQF